jgi:plastocyanin
VSRPDPAPLARRRLGALAAALALAVAILTACGSTDKPEGGARASSASSEAGSPSGSAAPGSSGSTVGQNGTLTATEADFSLTLGTKSLAAGPYVVTVENQGQATHTLVVERDGARIAGTSNISPGESASLSVTLKPGTYVFYCSIDNHRAMGMEVTVTVT